ncbi:MAG: hypothetical protein AAFX94_07900, partial [Myxococcota bacterium]
LGQIWTLAEREPSRAAATLRLRLGEVTTSRQRAWLWLELGRLEEHVGRRPEARAAYLAAASEAQQTHVLTNAIERFVAASESDSDGIAKLPNLHRYLERVGREDISARRILYRLAKSLVGARLRSAAIVLTDIRGDDAVARRSHYVHGAALLLRGQSKNALTSFRRAAEMDVKNSDERDRAVRDHAWLALARLAQESADVSEAIYAYHQIPIDSKLATTALLELGMLALEDGHSLTATAAFESLIATHEQDLGPRAALLQGYVLIEKGEFDAAAAHYDSIATDFETNLAAFDRAVGTVDDPYDLVRECTERQRAAASAALAPVLERPELERARSLFALEDEIEKLKLNLEEQRQALRALATPETPGPLREIAERIARLEALLRRTNTLAAARGKPRWRVASAAPDRCCTLPSDRIRTLRDRLETALTRARARREEIMATIAEEQAHADALAAELTRTGGAIAAEIRQEQTVLARQALDAHRQVLENLALEGRAGGLEALWAAKEVLSPRIYALEQKRQDALQEHYENHRDVIIELESAE